MFGTPFWFAPMTTRQFHHDLELIGWRTLGEGRLNDGRYRVIARSCGHFIVAYADRRMAAFSAARDMAMKLTLEGSLRLPRH